MIRTPSVLRVGLAGLAAVAMIGAGVATLAALPATADDATTLRITPLYPTDNIASAGTCMIYRAQASDALGKAPSDSHTVTITLTEKSDQATQDVDFCQPPTLSDSSGGSRVVQAKYLNGQPDPSFPISGTEQCYFPGPSLTPPTAAASGSPVTCTTNNPDVAAETSRTTTPNYAGTNSNPDGVDYVDDVGYTAAKSFIEFGVVGLVPGTATIDACFSTNSDTDCADAADVKASQVGVRFTSGGPPDSIAAYNAVTDIATGRSSYVAVKNPLTPASIDLTLNNGSGDTVFGVTPSFRVQSGPNANGAINSCSRSTDFGESACSYIGQNTGTDTLLIWVDHSAPANGVATGGPDPGEPTAQVTVTTYAAPSPSAEARFVDLTPASASTVPGQSRTFTATVTTAAGAPTQGTQVTFEETGPGQIQGGASPDGNNSTLTVSTGPDGRALVTITTQPGEAGTETITARISSATTDCGRLFNGQTGTCSDSSTNAIAGAPSPSPTPSGTKSPSATPTSTISPSPSSSAGCRIAVTTVNTKTINATGLASVTVSGVQPNSRVELQGYSQNHYGTANFGNDTTNPDRTGTASSSGTVTFNDLRPGSNTRLRARQVGCEYGGSDTINVRTQLSLAVTRIGTRQYRFDVDSIPARPGGLIVSIYRITGTSCGAGVEPRNCPGETFVGQTRVSAVNGAGRVTFTFDRTYPAREQFVLKTGQDAQNFPGRSNVRDLAIF